MSMDKAVNLRPKDIQGNDHYFAPHIHSSKSDGGLIHQIVITNDLNKRSYKTVQMSPCQ